MTRARIIALGVLAAVFTLVILHWSSRHGRLGQEMTADDSSYFADGLRRLEALYEGGMAQFVGNLLNSPPHSPYSTGMALLGFLFLGVHDWAPYLTNALLVFILLLFVDYAGRDLSRTLRNIMLFVALSVPFSLTAVHDFRPDFAVGLLTAIGIFFGLETAVSAPESRRRLFVAGLFFGAAFLTKPPFFPHTAVLALVPAAFIALAGFGWTGRPRRGLSHVALAEGCYFAGVLLPPLPFYAWDYRHIVGYVLTNTGEGAEAALWRMQGGPLEVLTRYTADSAIGGMLGSYFWAFVFLCVTGLALFAWSRNRPQALLMVGVLWAVSLSLAIMVYGRYANSFFGLSYQILLLFGAVRALGPHPTIGRLGNRLLVGGLVAFSLWNVLAPAGNAYARPLLGTPVRHARQHLHRLVDIITENSTPDWSPKDRRRSQSVAFTFWGDVNASSFDWIALKRGYDFGIQDFHRFGDTAKILELIDDAEFVVLSRPGTRGINPLLPSTNLQGKLIESLQSGGARMVLADFAAEGGGFLVLMRENLKTIDRDGASEGLLPVEGPYPQWHLGPVRWGIFPETTIRVEAKTKQPAEIALQARAQTGQRLTVLLNNEVIGEHVFATNDFVDIRAAGTLQPGQNRFTFRYGLADTSAADPRPRAVLFRRLDLFRH